MSNNKTLGLLGKFTTHVSSVGLPELRETGMISAVGYKWLEGNLSRVGSNKTCGLISYNGYYDSVISIITDQLGGISMIGHSG